jgi:hypothetical protein
MKKHLLLAVCSLLFASIGITSETAPEAMKPKEKPMNAPSASLGYVVLYVKDVAATLAFYEQAYRGAFSTTTTAKPMASWTPERPGSRSTVLNWPRHR